jgi:hypothetical protein
VSVRSPACPPTPRTIDIDLWQRALTAYWVLMTQHIMVAMFGMMALAWKPIDLGQHLQTMAPAFTRRAGRAPT